MFACSDYDCPPLQPGTELELTCINDPDNTHTAKFTVKDVRGRGGMSYVYTVEDSVSVWTLKEYCPKSIFVDASALRREGNTLVISPECRELYDIYKENLIQASKYQSRYIKQNLNANINNIGSAGFYEGNNTIYIRSVYANGISYDKIPDKDINFMFRIALATAKAVKQYHQNNILLIDIKPENILILKNNDNSYITDYIKFFDYDSMVTVDYARENPDKLIFSPNAPIEFKRRHYGLPDFSSDIFTIGAMIYKRIHGYDHVSSVAGGFMRYCDGRKGTLLYHAPSSLISATNEFLSHTLLNDQKRRYQHIDQVIDDLTKLVNMSMPEHIYLRDKRPKPSEKFSGRKNELKEIKRRLDTDNYVFLRGMGGVGKSELAKKFAEKYKHEYHTCQFVSYGAGMSETIGALDFLNLSEADFDGNAEELLKAKTDHLDFCDSKTLIIIDNVDALNDPAMDELLQNSRCKAKFIFTTRYAMTNYTNQTYNVEGMHADDSKALFFNCWECSDREKQLYGSCVEEISRIYNGNALLLRLMADVVNSSMGMYTPCDILEIAKNGDYDSVDCEIGYLYRDIHGCDSENMTVMNLLLKIFCIRKLDRTQFMILNNLSLVPEDGIECAEFIIKSGFNRNITFVINKLALAGWINRSGNRISVHSLISDLVSLMYAENSCACEDDIFGEYEHYNEFLSEVCRYIGDDSLSSISQVRRRVSFVRSLKRRCAIVHKNDDCSELPVYQFDITAGRLLLSIRDYNGAAEHLECAGKYIQNCAQVSATERISTDVLLCKAYIASGKYNKAMAHIQRAVETAENYNRTCDEACRISESALLLYKGEILDLKGLYDDAISLYEDILRSRGFDEQRIQEQIPDSLTLAALFHLGNSLSDKGDTVQAQKYLELELACSLKADNGEESVNTAITLAEIAENRLVSGDSRRALDDYSRAYDIMCRCAGEDDPKTRSIYYARIGVLSLIGETDEVIGESEKYVEHCRSLYGENSVQTAYAYKTYSEMLLQAGRVADAGIMIEKAVDIYDVILPADNPDYATALLNKAEILYTVGLIDEARSIIDGVSGIRFVSLVDNAIFHANYISLLTLTGDYKKAHKLCSEYISVAKTKRLNQLHLINAYNLMGNIYLRSGKSRKALKMYDCGLELAEEMDFSGKVNLNIWICRSNKGAAYLNLGLFNQAYSELEDSLNQLEAYYPQGHQRLVNIYINMGKCCIFRGEALNALDWFEKAHTLAENLGISSACEIMLELNSSLACACLGQTELAVSKCIRAKDLAQCLWTQDGENIQLAVILADLGLYTARNGDAKSGAEIIVQALEMLGEVSDEMFYEHAVMNKYLADICVSEGDYTSAGRYMDEALDIMTHYGDSTDIRTVDFCYGRAAVCIAADDYSNAEKILLRGFEFLCNAYEKLPDEDRKLRLVMLLCGIGELSALKNDGYSAEFFVRSAARISEISSCVNQLSQVQIDAISGDVNLLCGDSDKAEEYYGRAMAVLKNSLTGNSGRAVEILDSRIGINKKHRV